MGAKRVIDHMERAFGPAISILLLVDLGKDLYEYTKEKVQNRKKERTSNLTSAIVYSYWLVRVLLSFWLFVHCRSGQSDGSQRAIRCTLLLQYRLEWPYTGAVCMEQCTWSCVRRSATGV